MANSAGNTAGISEQQKKKLAEALGTSAATGTANEPQGNTGKAKASADSIESRVIDIVEDATGVEREEISRKSPFDNDLGIDSLTMVDIAVRLEEEFNISVEDEAISSVKNVDQLVKLVEKRV